MGTPGSAAARARRGIGGLRRRRVDGVGADPGQRAGGAQHFDGAAGPSERFEVFRDAFMGQAMAAFGRLARLEQMAGVRGLGCFGGGAGGGLAGAGHRTSLGQYMASGMPRALRSR